MKVQHAPSAPQSALLDPASVALTKAHSTIGTSVTQNTPSIATVNRMLSGEPSRLLRIHPKSAVATDNLARAGRFGASTTIASALLQRNGPVVPVHERRRGEIDDEEHGHDDRHRLDCLPGLVERCAADHEEELGIGDCRAERAALDDV